MYLMQVIHDVFSDLRHVLGHIDIAAYTRSSRHLSNATTGQHTRHIIELFQCLLNGYGSGIVNYDKRKRDIMIETSPVLAVALLDEIKQKLPLQNRSILIDTCLGNDGQLLQVDSNYFRELLYNLEHTIHHMALMRVAIQEHTTIVLPESFGVAPSTIQHRKLCVQ